MKWIANADVLRSRRITCATRPPLGLRYGGAGVGGGLAGFTLLEILVVLVILGVLAGVAGFSLSAAPASRADDAGSAARERALRAGVPVLDSTVEREQQLYLPDGRSVPILPWTTNDMPQ